MTTKFESWKSTGANWHIAWHPLLRSQAKWQTCLGLFLLMVSASFFIVCNVRADDFPAITNSEPEAHDLLTPQQALAQVVLPEGFTATLFAHEPEVQNPIAMSFDHRGRLWIAENYTYAERGVRFDLTMRDRVVILADEDGDGRADSRTVFTDQVQMLTGLVVGEGGVWLMCPDKLLFLADRDADDRADGLPVEVLDGFTVAQENYHNFANGLKWGHDGWLYGRCGASCPGEVGVPGCLPEERIPLRGGIWRFHPQRQIFEPLTQGTTNPWGHDWNAVGEPFFINTVNGHLWHAIPGAHFVRPHSLDANSRAYELIDQHADHWHFDTGKSWTDSRAGAANSFGGGHAHIGCSIYQGSTWPDSYRGKLLTLNMHGRRINVETLQREGSGYVGRHGPDMVLFNDPWFRGIDLDYGADGNVWVIDWSDTGECHDSTGVHRTSGRVYKISYGASKPIEMLNLATASSEELAHLHLHRNQWFVRHARQVLHGRYASGQDCRAAVTLLQAQFETAIDSQVRLDALWTLHLLDAISAEQRQSLLNDRDEYVRVAAIKQWTEFEPLDTCLGRRPIRTASLVSDALVTQPTTNGPTTTGSAATVAIADELARLARVDSSSAVRLAIASTLQRLPVHERAKVALALAAHEEDCNDHNLPLMIWYGLIPVADTDPMALIDVFSAAQAPTTRRLIARRLGEAIEANPAAINRLLSRVSTDDVARDLLAGLSMALAGWHKPKKPENWDAFAQRYSQSTDADVVEPTRQLSALFGDGRSVEALMRIVKNAGTAMPTRMSALQSLVDIRAAGSGDLCVQLLGTRYLNAIAVQSVARQSAPELGSKILNAYRSFAPLDRPAAIATLCMRPAWALALLQAVDANQIPKDDLSAGHVRQLYALEDKRVSEQLARIWGQVRESPTEKQQAIDQLKSQLNLQRQMSSSTGVSPSESPPELPPNSPVFQIRTNVNEGREVFRKVCGNCHRLYGEGGQIGPDLTGAQRQNLDYLLGNIIDPSAVVTADFALSTILMTDGRILSGIVTEKTPQRISLQMQNERLTLSTDEVEKVQPSRTSLMPDGLLQSLSPQQVHDLFAYLMTRSRID